LHSVTSVATQEKLHGLVLGYGTTRVADIAEAVRRLKLILRE